MKTLRREAFTLLELLVVITVVGVLTALLFPVVLRMKATGLQVQCSSNLRQIGIAENLYATDHNNLYAPIYNTNTNGPTWQQSLSLYLDGQDYNRSTRKSVFQCPAATFTPPSDGSGQASYGMNSYSFQPDSPWAESRGLQWGYRRVAVPKPTSIILVADMVPVNCDFVSTTDGDVWFGNVNYCAPGFRHRNGSVANVLFCDGHVAGSVSSELLSQPAGGAASLWKWW